TPLQLFQRMLPVIRHARCSNCHGGMDPRSPAHRGRNEVLTGSSCETCHNDAHAWTIPQPDHFFVRKTDKQVCALFSQFAANMGYPQFITNHLEDDELIALAFQGLIRVARDPGTVDPTTGQPDPPADPPPVLHAAFVTLAKDWINQ